MAKSYDFLFHKSDVTWRLSVNGLLLLLNRLKKSQRGVIRGLIIFMLWLNFIIGLNFTFFCFKLINIHYHTQIQRKIKFKPRTKSYHNLYYCDWSTIAIDLQLMHSDFLWIFFLWIFCDGYAFYSLLGQFFNFRCVCRLLFLNRLTPLSNAAQVEILNISF